jgi:hypothetical protein
MRDRGLAVPGPLQDATVIDEIDDAIAPARLPAEVRRLWEADGFSLTHPRHFFQVFYTSHDVMSVECDGPGCDGGCLFEWFLSDPDDPFVLRFCSVVDWLEVLLAALAEGAYQDLGNSILLVDHVRQEHLAAQRLESRPPHPQYGTGIVIPRDRTQWPESWLRREQRLLAKPGT